MELGDPSGHAGVFGQVGALIQREHQAAVDEGKDGDGAIGASDLIVELLADDALGRPAQVVTAKGDRSIQIVRGWIASWATYRS